MERKKNNQLVPASLLLTLTKFSPTERDQKYKIALNKYSNVFNSKICYKYIEVLIR